MSNNNKKSVSKKVSTFIFGEPIPVLSDNDIATIHRLENKLDTLLALNNSQHTQLSEPTLDEEANQTLDGLSNQVRKLAKTQFKANTLQESQLTQQQETIAALQQSMEQKDNTLVQQQTESIEVAQLEIIKSLLPVVDGLDAAFKNGKKQILKQPMPPETRQTIIAWLDGVRLARIRLLDTLKSFNVTPIPTVGKQFNPNLHIAITTVANNQVPNGTIVSQDRCGYATPTKILRFAEVVVAQSN